MKREPVDSSNIVSVGYDSRKEILEVEFSSGGIYQYRNVPIVVHKKFMDSSSLGIFLSEEIKGRYRYKKIN